MQDFKKLRVWHLAHALSLQVIRALPVSVSRKVPGLRGQAIRAATSVPWNIAEGCRCATRAGFLRYVETALESLSELEAQLLLARDASVIDAASYEQLRRSVDLVRRMLISLARTLRRRIAEDEEGDERHRDAG